MTRGRIVSRIGGCFFLLFCMQGGSLEAGDIRAAQTATAGQGPAQESRWRQLDEQVKALYQQGKYAEAVPVAQESVRVAEATFAPNDDRIAVALNNLGLLYKEEAQYTQAEPLFQRALQIREKALGPEHPYVAFSLNSLATLYDAEGKRAEAEPLYERAISIFEKVRGREHPDVALSLNNLAELFKEEGKFTQAEPLYQRALGIYEKAPGQQDLYVALTLNNLGDLYSKQGRYDQAEPLHQRALQIREKMLGPEHPLVATSLNNLAELYRVEGKYAQAEPLYQRSLRIFEKTFGNEHPSVAIELNNLALLYDQQAKYAQAEPLDQRALQIREKAFGPAHPDVALSLNNLAVLYREEGKFDLAEPLYQRALGIYEKNFGPDHPDVARSLGNLGDLYYNEGKYAEAESLYQRALRIREKVLGPEHPSVALTLNNLAELYRAQGKYALAEPLYQRARAIYEKALGPDHPEVARSLNNLAGLYKDQGRESEAEPLYQRALKIWENALGSNHPEVATALNNLALLYSRQNRNSEAEPLFQRALQIGEALGPAHPILATVLNNLAELYRGESRYVQAEPLYQRALQIREKNLGPEHPLVATTLNNLAEMYENEGKYSEAEPLFQRAVQIQEKALGPEHPAVALSLSNLAALQFASGKPEAAQSYFARDLDIIFHRLQYSFTYMTEKERLEFLQTVSSNFPGYFSFCTIYAHQIPALAGSMYDVLLWEKGFVGQSIAALRAKITAGGDPEALKLLDELTSLKQQLSALLNNPGPDRGSWQKQLTALQTQADGIEQQLVRRSSALQEDKKLERITWSDVQKALHPGEAAVEVVKFRFHDGRKWTGSSYHVALVVKPESKLPELIVLDDGATQPAPSPQSAQKTQTRAEKAIKDYGRRTKPQFVAGDSGGEFYQTFWQPLEKSLAATKTVYLAPDGALNQVSLNIVSAKDGRPLIEKFDLRIVNNTKDLLRESRLNPEKKATLVGNPKFLLNQEEQLKAIAQFRAPSEKLSGGEEMLIARAETNPIDGGLARDLEERGTDCPERPENGVLCPLPNTAIEIAAIQKLLGQKNWQVSTYHDEQALEESVKAVRHPRVLHLSTHGFFLPDQQAGARVEQTSEGGAGHEDPMLRSGMLFAGADRALKRETPLPNADDGVLTAYEASSLDLNGTELVVLSACETGLGEARAGEGVFGLRRAFQVAGAESVLMSMWKVPDRETEEMMVSFYQKWLSGEGKHQALRGAQRELRQKIIAREGHDVPYYWGAWVLVGK